ncbi:hypothetical protein XELAEV_18019249mg [Xenopus laevis]|uniref:G-protein coupled receptors family 3 profile domain-containing protein n=1 Tax=Xenopus laevis TaxID=8355 RepID=A0A974HU73_XENLA|nr:hypothetical protein XELAEV_18019249mg [Xenopus laevis]
MYLRLLSLCRLRIHLYWCIWHLITFYFFPASYGNDVRCNLSISEVSVILEPGDILIGVLLPFHIDKIFQITTFTETPPKVSCTRFLLETYQQFQAMRFALDEINKSLTLLPNITLGFYVYDSCAHLRKELEGTLWMLTGMNKTIPNYCCQKWPRLAAVLGHSISTYSILMAHILGLYRYPQISHFSTSSSLSDRSQFHSFFRTVPSDAFQSRGLAHLLLYFGWTWVGLIGMGSDYGQQGVYLITQELIKAQACVAFTGFILSNQEDKNVPYLTRIIKESTARVIVVFAPDVYFAALLDELLKQNLTGKIYVASEAWSISAMLSAEKYSSILTGSIGFAFSSSPLPGLKSYLNKVRPSSKPGESITNLFWENMFKCKFFDQGNLNETWKNSTKLCTGNEDLETIENSYNDVSNFRSAYSIYTSVQVLAQSLHNLFLCSHGKESLSDGTCVDTENIKPWQLTHYIQNAQVKLSNGREVSFDSNGDLPAVYDIVNWQIGPDGIMKQVKVGSYDTAASDGNIFSINISAVMWAPGDHQVPSSVCSKSCLPGFRRAIIRGKPICCFECVPCPFGEISNNTGSDDCSKCPWNAWPHVNKDRCIPKATKFLSFEEPLGTTLTIAAITSSLVPLSVLGLFYCYKSTPIVRANNYSLSCILLVSLFFCFLCTLSFIGYPQQLKCLLRQVTFGMVFTLCVSCILAKTIMVVLAFMATKPGSSLKKWTSSRVSYIIVSVCNILQLCLCICWLSLSPPFPEYNTDTQPEIIFIVCNEGSATAFWVMLGYLGFLATISFIVAFLARHLPESFNEARFITFSMLSFLTVWISFIPASLSARGQYIVAMEVFAILSSSWALVVCMFLPKCFIIVFRPNLNSREHLIRRARNYDR